jgi:3-methyladenine DNA glycosylase Mpg
LSFNGVDTCVDGAVGFYNDGHSQPSHVNVTPRIGIRVGTDRLWRWSIGR